MSYQIGNRIYPTRTTEVSAALEAAHTIVWPGQVDAGETVFVFRGEDELRSWLRAAPAPLAEQVARTDELARKAQALEHADTERAAFWQDLLSRRIMADVQGLAARLGADETSAEVLKLALQGASVLEPPLLHSAILFDRDGCGGAWRPLPSGVPFPNLSWIGFNDRAGAVRVHGFLALWRNRWFRGRRAVFTGYPLPCLPLLDVGFDNSASSALSW
jgi:hypothetical protein